MMRRAESTATRWWAEWLWPLAMALAICSPLLLCRGFALTHDMVFVPHQPVKGAWLGLDGSVPRAVPGDAVVSVLSLVVPGDLLQKAILVGLLVLGGVGAARVVPAACLIGRLAAATLFVWNPYVFERLAMGQWALLCGYAALPWVVVAAVRVRSGQRGGWPALCLAMAAAAVTSPTGGVLAAVVCLVLLVGTGGVASAGAAAISVAVSLPWLVPSLLYEGGIPSDPDGVTAFAARPDTPYGVVGSLVSLGGIWNGDVVPAGRGSWLLSGCVLLLCVAGLVGVVALRTVAPALPLGRLVVVGATGLMLSMLPVLAGTAPLMQWMEAHVAGAGLLRDSQKWVALLAVVECAGLAAAVTALAGRWRRHGPQVGWWLVAAAVALPIAAMPAMAWGLAGRLTPVDYPDDWSTVAALLEDTDVEGHDSAVAVLPWSTYRQLGWNDDRPFLDPAPRYLPGDVLVADTLVVGDRVVAGESDRAARVGEVLVAGGDVTSGLRRLGVGYVVVERGSPGAGRSARLSGDLLFDGSWLQLWSLGPVDLSARVTSAPEPGPLRRAAIRAGDAVAAATVVGAATMLLMGRARRYSRRTPPFASDERRNPSTGKGLPW